MPVASVLLLAGALALGLCLVMTGAWLMQRATGNAGWADAFWSLGTGAAGVAAALLPHGVGFGGRQWLVGALAAIWGLRLGLHIAARTVGASEDARYAQFRRDWGTDFQRRLFWFLQIQAAAALPLIATVFVAAHNPVQGWRVADVAGAAILLAAILGEGLADRQLAAFRRDPANHGKVCDAGLWRWSRHPNYFFEWLAWLAYPVIAIDLTGGWPWGWLALGGPLLIYWLLVHVSGIPPLEAHMLRSRGTAFRDYRDRTSAFFPWPPSVSSETDTR